ncbi:MAG: hypothetical protein MUO76_12940 [Anaerolineaceae bacterium]|nr:hypothetical protein [Anaerolineaceae bacterium]
MRNDTFDTLLLIARPGAGKSEIIDYLKKCNIAERIKRFHIGEFKEIDDFPILWRWFEEDTILSEMGYPHLHTDEDGYFIGDHLWGLLIELINLEYKKRLRDKPQYLEKYSTIVEFSRGTEHGGYRNAFPLLCSELLANMAILYVRVSWDESLRKNRERFNPGRPDSILEHGLPDTKLEKLYQHTDWEEISSKDPEFLSINGRMIPYVVFENEDDVTTARGNALGERLEDEINKLWLLYQSSRS